jgi:flagellar biosynthesis protein FlhG
MTDQAKALRGMAVQRQSAANLSIVEHSGPSAHTVAVTSGKGGVGKSIIALNLSIALARQGASVCLIDANLGLGNIDLLCGLNGYWNLSHAITGARRLNEVVLEGPEGIHVVPGASGLIDVADSPPEVQRDIIRQLAELEQNHDYVVIDTATGIHRSVRQFVTTADIALIVTTPEPTAIADAYATVRALGASGIPVMELIVNQAGSVQQARAIVERLQQTAKVFLQTEITSAGCVLYDPAVIDSVIRRTPFVTGNPDGAAAKSIELLARRIKNLTQFRAARGQFFPRVCDTLVECAH